MGLLKIYPPVRAYFINAAVFVSLMLTKRPHPSWGPHGQRTPRAPEEPQGPMAPQGTTGSRRAPQGTPWALKATQGDSRDPDGCLRDTSEPEDTQRDKAPTAPRGSPVMHKRPLINMVLFAVANILTGGRGLVLTEGPGCMHMDEFENSVLKLSG